MFLQSPKLAQTFFWTGNVPILWVYLQGRKQKKYFLLQRTPKVEHLKLNKLCSGKVPTL